MPDAPPDYLLALGRAVRERRRALGFTQLDLALNMDVDQRWISRLETGHLNLSYRSLRRVSAGLGVAPPDLIAEAISLESAATPDDA